MIIHAKVDQYPYYSSDAIVQHSLEVEGLVKQLRDSGKKLLL